MFLLYVNMDTVKCLYKTLLFILDQTIRLFLSNNLFFVSVLKNSASLVNASVFPGDLNAT